MNELTYYCSLEDRTLREEDTYKCILRECWYLLLLKPDELSTLRMAYKIDRTPRSPIVKRLC